MNSLYAKQGNKILETYIQAYREDFAAGRVVSPIRGLAEMYQRCVNELVRQGQHDNAGQLKNLTIGDIDPTTFAIDGDPTLAERLGAQPWGNIYEKKEKFKAGVAKDFWDRRMPLTRYQTDALGLLPLRDHFAAFLNGYGFSFTADQAIIVPGSMPGIHMFFEAVREMGKKKGQRTELVAPTPGFSVYYSQARQLDMEVVLVHGDSDTGFLPEKGKLNKILGRIHNMSSILYLTPANNPTSTVYSAKSLKETVDSYLRARPNGYLLIDLAYVEMVEQKRACEVLRVVKLHLEQTVFAVSMSKNFGVPRLRCAALLASNATIFHALKSQSQLEYASESYGMALEALALWKMVPATVREEMFSLLRRRQDRLITACENVNKNSVQPVFTGRFFREVPLYVYAELEKGRDVLDVFRETGMLGVPGEVFGDTPGQRIRFSVGVTPFQ